MEVNGYRQLFKTYLGKLFLLIISESTLNKPPLMAVRIETLSRLKPSKKHFIPAFGESQVSNERSSWT